MLSACNSAFHVVGHSYGAKVMLSALTVSTLPRTVASALLLQPAISYLSFAVDADGKHHAGGYRPALERVDQPILATFSSRDVALGRLFHLAVRRASDIGEQRIAAGPPSRYAALGGYGAEGLAAGEGRQVSAHLEGETYGEIRTPGIRVVSIESSQQISGHGDVSNLTTWWMLCDQVLHV
jgi:pimeloyl-ACP methyl ester carboxylesterase